MSYYSEDELRELFDFLAGNEHHKTEIATREIIIFGIKNYALGIPQEEAEYIIKMIQEKKSDFTISFEEFKTLWTTNIKRELDLRKFAEHLMTSIKDKIGIQYCENNELDIKGVKKLIKVLGLVEKPKKNYDHEKYDKEVEDWAKKMIKLYDVGQKGKIGIKQLESLVNDYYEDLKGKNNK
jgi:Ca2+-binding EF-hand superfamily protein